ncbi:MAG: serine/threonine-protein kinase [Gemmatimonadales bacterium]|nr:serine/threonine-protein kinase [Gemmatimonadales bacterium]
MDAELARRLGDRYALERLLGEGGMGVVWLARDRQLDRPVALKVLPPAFAAQPDLRERFLRETRTAAGFSHPNIVPVFAVEEREGLLAFAMGYVDGESLAERVRRAGPLAPREVVKLVQDVGYALAYAHGRGVVHRDIKPDNIMLERATGRALVMDFGIARAIAAPATGAGLTRVGEVVGTPAYMSPEQASGDQVDGRSDLYALGLVAWFALAGRAAVDGDSTQRILVKQLTEAVPPVAGVRPDVPASLAAAIDRCVAKEPAERFPTAEALVEAIDAAQLAAPEVPVALRLFEQGARQYVQNVLLLLGACGALWAATAPESDVDRLIALTLAGAGTFVLTLGVRRQAAGIRQQGFSHAHLATALKAIAAEATEARAQALAVPGVRRRHRVRLAMLPVLVANALWLGSRVDEHRVLLANGFHRVTRMGITLAVTSRVSLVVALLLFLGDPYRRPFVTGLAHAFWRGPLGRRLYGGGAARPAPVAAAKAPASSPAVPVPAADARLRAIESRLEALEAWRRARGG